MRHLWMFLGTLLLAAGSARAQQDAPPPSAAPTSAIVEEAPQRTPGTDGLSPAELPGGKIGLVRGVVKQTDPIHDELVIHAFGGGDVRIAFDPRTRLLPENTGVRLTGLPAGAIVSVDTVIDKGKLFARSVRTGSLESSAVELSGKVVRYDSGRSRLILRDPISPENVSLRVAPNTVVVDRGHISSQQSLSSDTLVRVWFSQQTATKIEILARRGDSFTFEGRILSVDLRSRVLALSNNTDQSVRELAIASLDADGLAVLREGAEVGIQAQFDGERYNVRTVTLVTPSQ